MAGPSSSTGSSADMELQPHHSINIPTPPQPNFPSSIYVSDRENYQAICFPLYEAALKGDWPTTQGIIGKFPQYQGTSDC